MVLKPTTPWTTPSPFSASTGDLLCPHCGIEIHNTLCLQLHMHYFHPDSALSASAYHAK